MDARNYANHTHTEFNDQYVIDPVHLVLFVVVMAILITCVFKIERPVRTEPCDSSEDTDSDVSDTERRYLPVLTGGLFCRKT